MLVRGFALLHSMEYFHLQVQSHTHDCLMTPFRYIGHFRFKGHSNSVITGPFLPYMYEKYFGVRGWFIFLKKKVGDIGFKEECEPKSQNLPEKECD